jgi:hypothetical protein
MFLQHLLLVHEAHCDDGQVGGKKLLELACNALKWEITFYPAQQIYTGLRFKVRKEISSAALPFSAPTKRFLR